MTHPLHLDDLRERWRNLKGQLDKGDEGIIADIEKLLEDCVNAGEGIAEAGHRAELQWLAGRIADALFPLTREYPNALIAPARNGTIPTVVPSPPTPPTDPRPPSRGGWYAAGYALVALVGFGAAWAIQLPELSVARREAAQARVDADNKVQAADQRATAAEGKADAANKLAADAEGKVKAAEKRATEAEGQIDTRVGKAEQRAAAEAADAVAPVAALARPEAVEAIVLERCLRLIRESRLRDGAIQMRPGSEKAWISPYFANHAALALLAAHQNKPDRAGGDNDLAAVLDWMTWYADRQDPTTGEVGPVEGLVGSYTRTAEPVGPTAPIYLLVVDRYHQLKPDLPNRLLDAARRSLAATLRRIDPRDGLPFAGVGEPDPARTKQLIPAVEAYAGLLASARLFTRAGMDEPARQARAAADELAGKLGVFWQPENGPFAYAIKDGTPQARLERLAPDVLANLFGLTWIAPEHKALRDQLGTRFTPDSGAAPAAPAEYWWMAARAGKEPPQIETYRTMTLNRALFFAPTNVYVHRPAVVVLAMLDGKEWLIPGGKPAP